MKWDDAFWIVDVEGNGANPPEIVELAMAEVKAMVPTGNRRHWLVHPNEPILQMVTRIHGITNEDVAEAPSFDEIADDVLTWIEGAAIVGHNVKVDLEALKRVLPHWEPRAAIDTLKLAKAIKPGLQSYSLSSLSEALGITPNVEGDFRTGAHSAPYDVALTVALFRELLSSVPEAMRSTVIGDADIVERQKDLLL
ncbi:3'-5' exonuclease [Bosea sp. AS-1]|uniref:3'-5' exonuclease n=1 Tax=Bosea sp. AS-1 TaxID=2015316 RepID=UPI000B795B51|nr:3'-5' exonuclease [Bosea sp. AS-1]